MSLDQVSNRQVQLQQCSETGLPDYVFIFLPLDGTGVERLKLCCTALLKPDRRLPLPSRSIGKEEASLFWPGKGYIKPAVCIIRTRFRCDFSAVKSQGRTPLRTLCQFCRPATPNLINCVGDPPHHVPTSSCPNQTYSPQITYKVRPAKNNPNSIATCQNAQNKTQRTDEVPARVSCHRTLAANVYRAP